MTKITDPLVRPYARLRKSRVVRMFEQASDEADIETAAKTIHELAHRRKWLSERANREERMVSRFPLLATASHTALSERLH